MGLDRIPAVDERVDGGDQRSTTAKRAIPDDAPLQDTEPELDLVNPRSMLGRVQKMEAATMPLVEILPALACVDIEVVPNHVHGPRGIALCELLEEGNEVVGGAALATAEDLAGLHIESADQRDRPIARVLELATPWPATTRLAQRMVVLQSLHPGFFVDA